MLAAAGDYLKVWQLPLMAVVMMVWLVGGGYLFQKILRKRTELRKYRLGQGVLVSLLSGAGGGMAAIALYFIGKTIIPVEPNPLKAPICWFGVGLGVPGYFLVAYLVVFSMHKLSAGETLKASILPIVGPVVFGALVMGVSFYFSAKSVQADRKHLIKEGETRNAMKMIHNALERKMLQTGLPAESLEQLVKDGYLEPEVIQSPANPKGRGFFYNGDRPTTDKDSKTILLCDYAENFGDKGRVVLYTSGSMDFLSPVSFESRLKQTENQRFAKALEEAEKKK